MEYAYDLAGIAVRHRLRRDRPKQAAILNTITVGEVAVFTGTFDEVQHVLGRLKVRYSLDPKLGSQAVAFANCCSGMPDKLTDVGTYVERGGWLISSDWALSNVVAPHFPNTIGPDRQRTGDEVVSVEPSVDSAWDDVVVLGADPQWWLESASHTIKVHDHDRVCVEAASHEMLEKYDAPIVAARFNWGAGHVYHVVSHFWLKHSRQLGGRYAGPAADFLRAGMGFNDDEIAQIAHEAKVKIKTLTFAEIQSAVTSTELVARLVCDAVHAARARRKHKASPKMRRLLEVVGL